MARNKSLPSVSISDLYVGYKAMLWRYITKLLYMNKLYAIGFGTLEIKRFKEKISL